MRAIGLTGFWATVIQGKTVNTSLQGNITIYELEASAFYLHLSIINNAGRNGAREAATIDASELLMIKALRAVKILRLSRLQGIVGSTRPFTDYFRNFDKVEAVRRIFGDKTEQVLRDLKVEFIWTGGYMGVNSANGNLLVSPRYLNKGDKIDIYLDVIHELVHVRQFMEGKELFDDRYCYTERPTEIEAYRHTVEEARRLGLSDERIYEYLRTEWVSERELEQLASTVNVRCRQAGGK